MRIMPMINLHSHTARYLTREVHGIVISAGLMQKTVKVRVGGQKWHPFLQKYFDSPRHHLVHDPTMSLRMGDIIAMRSGWRTSKHKRHVVTQIIKPSGIPIHERPPLLTSNELTAGWLEKRAQKESRRQNRD
jgi:small subunit ribosomal protein S17